MKTLIQNKVDQLKLSINAIQSLVIGYVKYPGDGNYELLIDIEYIKGGVQVTSLIIGKSLGIHTTNAVVSESCIKIFPDYKTLSEMMDDPILFNQWCKDNNLM